jgi:site-specific DNA recombinase
MTGARPSKPTKLRAVGYARVSTRRQAAHELSLNDQEQKIGAFCVLKEAVHVQTFVERGLSGRSDRRPALKEMMAFAMDPANGIDLVVVYSLSRFFRNTQQYLEYKNLLKTAGVRLVSASQEIPEGPHGELMETILAAFDSHASEVNSETTKEVMLANAGDGFWNGGTPPFGYRTEVALMLRRKEKKVLVVDDVEAGIVNRIFEAYVHGLPHRAPMGMKALATYFNETGLRYRGSPFSHSVIERVLRDEAYIGTHYYNTFDSRTGKPRPQDQWVAQQVPAIVSRELFDAARRLSVERRQSRTPSRVVNGPTLLTGIARCETCGEGMMLRTGKGGRYRYLTCAKAALKGNGCGHTVRMDAIDEVVLSAVEKSVFSPARLKSIVASMADSADENRQHMETELARHRAVLLDAKSRQKRLYDALEDGVADPKDPEFKERLTLAGLQISEATTMIGALSARMKRSEVKLTDAQIRQFGDLAREKLRSADPAFRRSWLHLFVDRVIVGPERIVIRGPNEPLITLISKGGELDGELPAFAREPSNAASVPRWSPDGEQKRENTGKSVPSSARKWRALRDSNS